MNSVMCQLKVALVTCCFLSGSLLEAARFGDFIYTDHGSYVEITGYSASGDAEVVVPSEINADPVTHIGDSAFSEKSITSVSLPGTMISIGDFAFNRCWSLSSINIPDGVEWIGYAAIAFTAIERIEIPASVTHIGGAPFLACGLLGEIVVDPANTSYSSQDGVLYDLDKTTLMKLPSGYAYETYVMLATVNSIASTGLEPYIAVKDIDVAQGNTAFSSIDGVLYNADQSTILRFPVQHEVELYSIPESVARIDEWAFAYAEVLSTVIIPSSVSEIRQNAFEGAGVLEEIYFYGDAPTVEANAFLGTAAQAYVFSGQTGFTFPTWEGLDIVSMGASTPSRMWRIEQGLAYDLDLGTTLGENGAPLLLAYAFSSPTSQPLSLQTEVAENQLLLKFYANRPDVDYQVLTTADLNETWEAGGVSLSTVNVEGYRTASIPMENSSGFLKVDVALIE